MADPLNFMRNIASPCGFAATGGCGNTALRVPHPAVRAETPLIDPPYLSRGGRHHPAGIWRPRCPQMPQRHRGPAPVSGRSSTTPPPQQEQILEICRNRASTDPGLPECGLGEVTAFAIGPRRAEQTKLGVSGGALNPTASLGSPAFESVGRASRSPFTAGRIREHASVER